MAASIADISGIMADIENLRARIARLAEDSREEIPGLLGTCIANRVGYAITSLDGVTADLIGAQREYALAQEGC